MRTVEQRLERIERMLEQFLYPKNKKETLVKVSAVQQLTGWDKKQLRRMRDTGSIKMIRNTDGIFYDLQSIPKEFIKVGLPAEIVPEQVY